MSDLVHLTTNRAISALGDRLRDEKELPDDRQLLERFREFLCTDLAEIFGQVRAASVGCDALLSCRVKRLDTIVRKLKREPTMDLVRMDDIVGFRLLAPSLTRLKHLSAKLTELLPTHRERDYVKRPTVSGYRAIHLVIRRERSMPEAAAPGLYPIEIQLRTYYQHLWSTTSESFGERVKEGGGTQAERAYLTELSRLIMEAEERSPDGSQIGEASQSGPLSFFILQLDKRSRSLVRPQDYFGSDLGEALTHLSYLEELSRKDLSRETVLLGAATTGRELQLTHLRYYTPQGIPDLPAELVPDLPRP